MKSFSVYDYGGGVKEWEDSGYPLEGKNINARR